MKNDNTADFSGNRRQKILILQLIQGFNKHNHIINPFRGGGTIMYHLFCLSFFYISDRFWHFIYANIYLLGS